MKDARREGEKEREAENEDVRFASWEQIRSEELEDAPAIVFTVTNSRGAVSSARWS